MIRAREDIDVEVEVERVPAKRQRNSSSPTISTDDDCIKINYGLGMEIKFHKDLTSCNLCHENLNPGYSHLDCSHNLCRECSEKKMSPAGFLKCPMCREESVGMKQLPMLTAILDVAPRTLKCGKAVAGWKGERLHANCFKCLEVELREFKDENKSLKKTNSNLMKINTEQSDRIDILTDKLKEARERYESLRENLPIGSLRADEDSEDSDDESTEV
jgi:hypothetical protein